MPVYTYTTLDDPSAGSETVAHGINGAGQIVGYYRNANGVFGFLESGGTLQRGVSIRPTTAMAHPGYAR